MRPNVPNTVPQAWVEECGTLRPVVEEVTTTVSNRRPFEAIKQTATALARLAFVPFPDRAPDYMSNHAVRPGERPSAFDTPLPHSWGSSRRT